MEPAVPAVSGKHPIPPARAVSGLEFLLGACLVIGHNVFHVVPNEVPILFIIGLVSVRWRNGGFGALGFRRPASWGRVVLVAAGAAAVRIGLGELVIDPLTSRVWPPAAAPKGASEITGHLGAALLALLIVWTFAAFGEEIGYRGYLLTRAAESGGGSAPAWWAAMVLVSVLFGYGHYYKGLSPRGRCARGRAVRAWPGGAPGAGWTPVVGRCADGRPRLPDGGGSTRVIGMATGNLPPKDAPSTHDKALRINIDARRHGTFAEIGAGQEVARWFFHVGGAAGTVAKTMSAYDMAVSDAIYGPCVRYVSRQRLQAMIDHEWGLLLERLDGKRGATTAFFVFADSVATRSYTRREDGHGWLGIRFQTEPRAAPSDILIHARMWDTEPARQQEALGILGVNLLHAAFYRSEPPQLIGALMDGLTRERMEVDMVKFSGPAFAGVDNRLMSLQLVHQRLTNAAIFTAAGDVVEPAEVLHAKPVLIERGSFRPVTNVTLDMLESSLRQIREGSDPGVEEPVVLMEMTLRHLLGSEPDIDHADFLARVDTLSVLGKMVMISNYSRFHNVAGYLRRYTRERVVMDMGIPTLAALFDERHYQDMEGGILEAFGRLFVGPTRLHVYPWRNHETGEMVTLATFKPPASLRHLFTHLVDNGFIEPIRAFDARQIDVLPRDVLREIRAGDPTWETLVPPPVVERIKREGLFGYPPR
jgi:membrane protease YdiL (CAAX protease family)